MRRATWLIAPALVVVIMLGAVACSGSEGDSSNGTADPGTTEARNGDVAPGALDFPAYSDPNTPIYVALGRRFALKLESEPSAGYSWQVANELNPAVLTPLGTQLRSETPGLPGAPAQQYISFAANGVGSATIEVHYVSPGGQTSTDPAPMTFNVTVTFDGQPPPPPPIDLGTTLPTR
jgi:predicted secreted protein